MSRPEYGEYTNGTAIDIIENEGLGYAVRHYISGDAFKDPETQIRWNNAAGSLEALIEYLQDETGREIDA
jgi:hypothetical protein